MIHVTNAFTGKTRVILDLDELEAVALLFSGNVMMGENARQCLRFGEYIAEAMRTGGKIKVIVGACDHEGTFAGEIGLNDAPKPIRARIRLSLQFLVHHYRQPYEAENVFLHGL